MKYIYILKWFIGAKFFNRKAPLQSVIFICDNCNLQCRHCNVVNNSFPNIKSYSQIVEELHYCYDQGSRFVDFEGGEPMIWKDKDKDKDVNDLIDKAKSIGFFSTTVTTNAQLPINNLKSNSIWVSLDGINEYHDFIRGEGSFKRLEENINASNHKFLYVNMVINSNNYSNVENTVKYVKDNNKINSISLNFHTPFEGTDELFLDWEKRKEVIDLIIKMKKKGYPILNSISGLKIMKDNNFKKYCWVSNFILSDGNRLKECPGSLANRCSQCGLCMAGEMHSVLSFKLDTLFAGIHLRI